MDEQLQSIERQAGEGRSFESPPLHLWNPDLSGDIPIRIATDGSWYHDGDLIQRDSLVALFASILRREEDGEYYLVTPVEKWRLQVELHPLVVIDIERQGDCLVATLNTGRAVQIGADHPLFLEPAVGGVAAIELWHGLTALFSRNAWYRLVELAEERDGTPIVSSGDYSAPIL